MTQAKNPPRYVNFLFVAHDAIQSISIKPRRFCRKKSRSRPIFFLARNVPFRYGQASLPARLNFELEHKVPGTYLLFHHEGGTIGAKRLNFSVRNGKRCCPLAKAPETLCSKFLAGEEWEEMFPYRQTTRSQSSI